MQTNAIKRSSYTTGFSKIWRVTINSLLMCTLHTEFCASISYKDPGNYQVTLMRKTLVEAARTTSTIKFTSPILTRFFN